MQIRDKRIDRSALPASARFLIAGVVNTVLTYLLFLGLATVFTPSIAYTLTYMVGVGAAYFLNVLFVFKTGHSKRMAIAVPVSYLAQYLYGLGALNTLILVFRLPGHIAMAGVIASALPLQFLILQFAAACAKR